jgi:hypothetical protein
MANATARLAWRHPNRERIEAWLDRFSKDRAISEFPNEESLADFLELFVRSSVSESRAECATAAHC